MNSAVATIDMERIKQIESSGNPRAFNARSGARGHFQITPICLKEWNDHHPKDKHFPDALYKPEVNRKIAEWYMTIRIPQILKAYGITANAENILIAFNWGPGNLRKYMNGEILTLPQETQNYLFKYRNNI